MRRRFTFTMPTLLLWPIVQVAGLIIFWLSQGVMADNAFAAAPITPSGLNTQVSAPIVTGSGASQTTQYNITGGTRPGGGTNLFHSFGDFNVPKSNIANFLNDSGLATSNILGRVTGGNISNIFGTIQTTGFGNANFFLMNPAGFLFGPNATVNVGGMVSFSSADYLRLADGKLFNAIPNPAADALLSTAPVAAYGFLGSNPGAITVQGSQLSVTEGTGISLVGGKITVQNGTLENGTIQPARLSAPNGQINLATAASPGEFLLQGFQGTDPSLLTGPNINGASFASFGSVHLAPGSTVDVSQTGNGRISVRGGQLVVDIQNAFLNTADPAAPAVITPGQDTVVLAGGSTIFSQTSSADTAPDVQVVADRIQFLGTPPSFDPVFTPPNPVNIFSETFASGNAGNITLTASQNIDLMTTQIHSTSPSQTSTGNAGNINLSSTNGNILMTDGAFINSQAVGAAGEAGTITVNASHGDINMPFLGVLNNTIGNGASGGGGIEVTANNLNMGLLSAIQIDNFNLQVPKGITVNLSGSLNLTDSAGIFTVARGPALAAAPLNITAHDVSISGGGFLNTETQSSGPGGQLSIFTNNLSLLSGGQIKSGSTFGSNPDPNAPPDAPAILASGPGGRISIQGLSGPAASVLIDGAGSGIFTNALGTGAAGNTNITAQSVTIQNGGTISASTSGIAPSATAGTITISTAQLALTSGGSITSGSAIGQDPSSGAPVIPSGPGGTINIQGLPASAASVLIDGAKSGIFTDTVGTGAAGNTNIAAQSLTIQNGGTISAATSGTTPSAIGGDITINANQVQVNSGGVITAATTGAGAGGSVNINAGNTFSSDAGTVSSTTTQTGGGGNINIAAGNSVTLTNGASISASSTGQGSAGDIQINAGQNFTTTNSSVTTEALNSSGGTIKITTNPNGTVQLTDSIISASVKDGAGGGGSVNIDPQFVILQNSQIIAKSVFGPGGNINITTNLLLPDTVSIISASSQFGQQGTIVIQSPISPASGKIVPLGQKPLLPTSLLSQRCAALSGGNISSFTVAGRDALPAEPGGWVSTPLALSTSESEDGTVKEAGLNTMSTETVEEIPILSLRKVAPVGFLTQSFAVSADCAS